MMIFDKLSDKDILLSMIAETAKSLAEVKCLRKDAEQVEARLRFNLSALHYLNDKTGDLEWE